MRSPSHSPRITPKKPQQVQPLICRSLVHMTSPIKNSCLTALILTALFCHSQIQTASAYDPNYLNEVVGQKAVTVADGFELILILMQLEDRYPDFETQKNYLLQENIIKPSWDQKEEPLRYGALAYMLTKMLRLKGGLKARIFGISERFAMEELSHQGILREGHKQDLITGQELVIIMTQAAQFLVNQQNK